MIDLGIKSNRELADIISRETGKTIHPYTIGKWIADKSRPRGDNLIALIKALKFSADLLVLEEGQNPEEFGKNEIEKLIREVVRGELSQLIGKGHALPNSDVSRFLSSDKIPEEDKEAIRRQIKNLLKMYEKPKPKGEHDA